MVMKSRRQCLERLRQFRWDTRCRNYSLYLLDVLGKSIYPSILLCQLSSHAPPELPEFDLGTTRKFNGLDERTQPWHQCRYCQRDSDRVDLQARLGEVQDRKHHSTAS